MYKRATGYCLHSTTGQQNISKSPTLTSKLLDWPPTQWSSYRGLSPLLLVEAPDFIWRGWWGLVKTLNLRVNQVLMKVLSFKLCRRMGLKKRRETNQTTKNVCCEESTARHEPKLSDEKRSIGSF